MLPANPTNNGSINLRSPLGLVPTPPATFALRQALRQALREWKWWEGACGRHSHRGSYDDLTTAHGPLLLVPAGLVWVRIATYLIGKFGITVSYTVLYVLTAELFPTNVRHSLFAMCSMIGRLGSVIAPQTPLLGRLMESLPVILFGSMSLVSGLLALVFPETHNTKLPDTIEEAENIGRSGKKSGGDGPVANGGNDVVLEMDKGSVSTAAKRTSVSARPSRVSTTSISGRPSKKTSVCSLGSVQVTVPEKSSSPSSPPPDGVLHGSPASSSSPTAAPVEPETITVHL